MAEGFSCATRSLTFDKPNWHVVGHALFFASEVPFLGDTFMQGCRRLSVFVLAESIDDQLCLDVLEV